MMKRLLRLGVVLTTAALSLSAIASESVLGPGSAAPAISIKTWYKGKPVTIEKGKMYVVEFWATWCGPCIQSIPHITKLAKANPDVTFVGASIWEDDKDGNIAKFVKDMGEKMDYNVGYSGNQEGMAVTWMKAAKQNGIPSAFIIKDKQIMWVGHPMEMDEPLAQIKAGKWDVQAARAKFDADILESERRGQAFKDLRAADKMYGEGKKAEAEELLRKVEKDFPEMASDANMTRLGWMASDNPEGAKKKIDEMAGTKKEQDLVMVASFAMQSAGKPATKGIARYAIDAALKAGENKHIIVLYYGIMVLEQLGENKAALECAEAAMTLRPNSELKDNDQFKQFLEKKVEELKKKVGN